MIVDALFRYPVKSMAGERLDAAEVGWHGIDGDRRFALRRIGAEGGRPWLTASTLAELVRFTPLGCPPTHVRTPDGRDLPLGEIAGEVARLYGKPVELMQLHGGIFDEAPISAITTATIGALDMRRFRPNIVVRADGPVFHEDRWVGRVLDFDGGPAVSVQLRDERCVMVNLDPDTAESDPQIFRAIVRANDSCAGVYATVIRCGRIAIGQRVSLR